MQHKNKLHGLSMIAINIEQPNFIFLHVYTDPSKHIQFPDFTTRQTETEETAFRIQMWSS